MVREQPPHSKIEGEKSLATRTRLLFEKDTEGRYGVGVAVAVAVVVTVAAVAEMVAAIVLVAGGTAVVAADVAAVEPAR